MKSQDGQTAVRCDRDFGIAAHRSFVSYIATVVHVEVGDKGKIVIPRVDTAIDCGYCVHPERVRSQIEGAAVMGLTLAKHGEITLKNGAVEQSNFNDYPLVRIDELPTETRTHIVEHPIDVPPSGVGEPGVPPVRAGALQRHLRRDRQTHPPTAHRRPARLTSSRSKAGGTPAFDLNLAFHPADFRVWLPLGQLTRVRFPSLAAERQTRHDEI